MGEMGEIMINLINEPQIDILYAPVYVLQIYFSSRFICDDDQTDRGVSE
jgi:tetrahydromethanopterin S-methyltransferase subunit F